MYLISPFDKLYKTTNGATAHQPGPLCAIITRYLTILSIIVHSLTQSCKYSGTVEEVTNPIVACINDRDSSLLITLDKYETFLIQKGYIKSNSYDHYMEFLSKSSIYDINRSEIIENVFEGKAQKYFPASPGRYALIIKCIKESELEKNSELYELTYNILTKQIKESFQELSEQENLNLDINSTEFDYNNIPRELFHNEMIHYCFLWSIYP